MDNLYDIFLGGVKIGTTAFEYADPPMGVVFGKIIFFDTPSPGIFLKEYSIQNNLDFKENPKERLISTFHIPDLKIISSGGVKFKAVSNSIEGMDNEDYYISLLGVTYPSYGEEFPHHVNNYHSNSKKQN